MGMGSGKKAKILDEVIVACDDKRIEEAVKSFGARQFLPLKNIPAERIESARW